MYSYSVVETFYSLQGEGVNVGQLFYFIRLAGCDVGCKWCDTKQSWNKDKYPKYNAIDLLEKVLQTKAKSVIITGGEPLLHDLTELSSILKNHNLYTAIETSGVGEFSGQFDWITFSPKKHHLPQQHLIYQNANELKIIIENEDDFLFAEENACKVNISCKKLLQPQWDKRRTIIPIIINYIKSNPQWSLSLQCHKYINIE